VKAAVLRHIPSEDLEIVDVPEPGVGPGEVLVSVEACGICGTDLHIMEGLSYRPELPLTLGHEPVGVVSEVGDPPDRSLIGQRVVPTLFVGCNECEACRSGDERLCQRGAEITGVTRPGGFADRLVLQARQLVLVRPELSVAVAASLVDAGPTAHNAARVALARPGPTDAAHLVIGAGPVGFLVSELLRHHGAEVVVAEPNPERRGRVEARGHRVAESVSAVTGSFKTVIDCAAAPDVVYDLLGALLPHGSYISVGYAKVPEFDFAVVARKELAIYGIRSGRRTDLEAMLGLVADGTIAAPGFDSWPLEDINTALHSLRSGLVPGKAVIMVGSSLV
jgi:2-desacetyl-2-hydroxyethyl bacteriochlorophyllide A dehydrogenase